MKLWEKTKSQVSKSKDKKLIKQELKTEMKKVKNGDYAVEMVDITKTFLGGKIVANSDVTFRVKKNEVHAICGENGAGKSTLMSILFGLYKPDKGQIIVNGNIAKFKSAADANKNGLGMVHQHFKLVQAYTLLDNIILGVEKTRYGFLDKKTSAKEIAKIANEYKLSIDLDKKTSEASVGMQQRTEIIKLLYRGADILIFDEPTAVLTDEEIKGFLEMILFLKKQGKTIILITHKLNEVQAVADRITILRKGASVGTYNMKDVNYEKIVELMVGNKVVENPNILNFANEDKTVVEIKNIKLKKQGNKNIVAVNNLSLKVNAGDILGIAGIEGNGQSELALALTGLHKVEHGEIFLLNDGREVNITNCSPKTITQLGVSHVPEDRHKYGLILDESVAYNMASNQIDTSLFSKFGFLRLKEIAMNASNLCTRFNVMGANNGKTVARGLSGGNQQKVVVARGMIKKHNVIILVQPTRGLDVGAINFIHEKILEEAKAGIAVILISYELDEILKVSSRIAVMDQGKIVFDKYKKDGVDRQTIGKYLMRTAQDKTKSKEVA